MFVCPNNINPKHEHLKIRHQKYTIYAYVPHPRDHARTIAHVPHAPIFSKMRSHYCMRATRTSVCVPVDTRPHRIHNADAIEAACSPTSDLGRGDARDDGHTRCRRCERRLRHRHAGKLSCDRRVYNKITRRDRTLFSVGRFKCLDTHSHLAAAAYAAPNEQRGLSVSHHLNLDIKSHTGNALSD